MNDQPQNLSEITEESAEEKELRLALLQIEKYPKLKQWALLFTDKENKATYGNRTESVVQAGYNVKDRISAAEIGAQNFRKLKGLASLFAEDKGRTLETVMNTIIARAETSERRDWMDLFLEITGYREPKGAIVVNNNTQNNIQMNVDGSEATNFNHKFREFLEKE